MTIWYCVECGDYQFSEPKSAKEILPRGSPRMCSLCKTPSIINLNNTNAELHSLSKELEASFRSKRFDCVFR
jgi:hypothetical protein